MNQQLVIVARSACIHVAFMPVVLMTIRGLFYVAWVMCN